ncbi:hypothetical protein ACIQXF_21835 [Lysinibacillus sp. NPDC097231]|uniref:hypothetical protein n=1 Tax=Lysinibacillus sp. NPDC097231 TaxID=3364142 RepID=UPI003809D9DA
MEKILAIHVLEKLKEVAMETQESLDTLVTRYLHERLLYRLSISSYQDQFLLQDDSLLVAFTDGYVKPLQEITLSVRRTAQANDIIQQAFKEICAIELEEEGIVFLGDELESILQNDVIYLKIPASVGEKNTYIEVKLWLTDQNPLAAQPIAYPTILEMPSPVLVSAAPEYAIALTFAEMYQYPAFEHKASIDVFALLKKKQKLEGRVLQACIEDVFEQKRITIEKEHPLFIKPLNDAGKQVQEFLRPIHDVLLMEDEFFKQWDHELQAWQ